MDTPRNCCVVIDQMLKLIPSENSEFIADLKWNLEDAFYKPPEETIQWHRTASTLQKHIPIPAQDWEFEIISIFSMKPVEILKKEVSDYLEASKNAIQ